jgi:D-3-phosphoglycerate dehydrogenase / 2-oxoglutarate reductase
LNDKPIHPDAGVQASNAPSRHRSECHACRHGRQLTSHAGDGLIRQSVVQEGRVAKFRIATPAGASFTVAGGDYGFEMEALTPIDAEIFEIPPGSEDDFVAAARDADALYAKGRPITKRMIDGLGSCKIIALGSVGVDSVDVEAATARGIPVTNCPDTFIEEVADHAMRLILATHGRLVVQDRLVREGRWAEGRPMLLKIPRLRGMTVGLIAFGHVARAVAERAKPFGLHIIAYDPFIEEIVMVERGIEPVSLPELLARADIISMHSPATASANRMIREEHFRQMKKTAIYVSTGRGPTTDEAALIKALDEGMIAGAGLDVLEQEPPGGNNPLLKMDNVILTAHVASATSRFDPARRRRVGQELSLVLTGRWPMSCVNPSVLAASDLRRWQPVSMERGPNS